jgi:hypothetical protein
MDHLLDLPAMLGGYAIAISLMVGAWWSLHREALRQRRVSAASLFELGLLVALAVVVTAWMIHTFWP